MKPLRWEENTAIPRCAGALLASLRFGGGAVELPACSESEWKTALYFCDRNQLTLLLNHRLHPRLEKNLADNRERVTRLKKAFASVKEALDAAGIEFVTLKGFTHWERFWPDPATRIQYDLDLFCPSAAAGARDALLGIGYESLQDREKFPTDHLPALVRKTGWQWRGDFFDPEIPISVELHFRLWDESTEGFEAPGVGDFWPRRVTQSLDGRDYLALDPVDSLGYAALHLLRHLLRGDARAANVYELAYFLDRNAGIQEFWERWIGLHPPELRRLQAIGFRLAAVWFGCRMSPAAQAEVDLLPASVRRWFEHSAASPLEAFFHPNKDELWLHLCLLDSFRKKSAVLRRRLLPTRMPAPLDSVYIPEAAMNWRLRVRKRWQYGRYVVTRGVFHARALLPTLSSMLKTRF